jgi:hypothetical protein
MQAIVVAGDHDEREVLTFILRHAGMAVSASSELQRVLENWLEHPCCWWRWTTRRLWLKM